ncbi:YicC/YloC family endoribonuclease [Polynucleobacter sp. IMCC 29146]|uniref:YicC/YloC family endoribonuclease n=1 Tax=Polynucleobacter sp. IMCC 29146 TaxID=2780953 RepID=UPI001F2CC7CA|nr:YicC/YloC family endoribonuclease [Polynucleobacter sp. IMCC 29146]MCE7529236.1 YicC family protein [Polynucleobacter sp. IMCC 29146]
MISSMTGYGSASRQVSLGAGIVADLQLEVRAVNSRFLDLSFRLPDECRAAEPALRELAVQQLTRGKVEFRAVWRINSSGKSTTATAEVSQSLSQERCNALQVLAAQVQTQFTNAAPLSIADVLRWPGMVSEPRGDEEVWVAATLAAGTAALQALVETRAAEGQALAAVLQQITTQMRLIVEQIEPQIPEFVQQYQLKLTARLTEALASQASSGQHAPAIAAEVLERIRQEVVLYAVRIDVAEEFARLKTHFQAVETALKAKGPVGKRLDFLMQELNREANTLSSKSAAVACTSAALELKLLIEQMREQVQNLE